MNLFRQVLSTFVACCRNIFFLTVLHTLLLKAITFTVFAFRCYRKPDGLSAYIIILFSTSLGLPKIFIARIFGRFVSGLHATHSVMVSFQNVSTYCMLLCTISSWKRTSIDISFAIQCNMFGAIVFGSFRHSFPQALRSADFCLSYCTISSVRHTLNLVSHAIYPLHL